MFVKNERGNFRSLYRVDTIGVGTVDETENGGTVRWVVYLDHNTPVNRLAERFDTEEDARAAAEKVAADAGGLLDA